MQHADAGISVVNQRKTNDAGLKFSSTFRHSGIHGACPLSVGVCVRVCGGVLGCVGVSVRVYKCRNAGLSGI